MLMSSQEIKLRFKVVNICLSLMMELLFSLSLKPNQRGKNLPVHVWVIKERKVWFSYLFTILM